MTLLSTIIDVATISYRCSSSPLGRRVTSLSSEIASIRSGLDSVGSRVTALDSLIGTGEGGSCVARIGRLTNKTNCRVAFTGDKGVAVERKGSKTTNTSTASPIVKIRGRKSICC